jgi:hypothetical protein
MFSKILKHLYLNNDVRGFVNSNPDSYLLPPAFEEPCDGELCGRVELGGGPHGYSVPGQAIEHHDLTIVDSMLKEI